MRPAFTESLAAFCDTLELASASINLLKRFASLIKTLPESINIVTLYQTLYVIQNFIATEYPHNATINHFFALTFSDPTAAFTTAIDNRVSTQLPAEWLCESGQFKLQALDRIFRIYHCNFQTIFGKAYRAPYKLFLTQQLLGILKRTQPTEQLQIFDVFIQHQINEHRFANFDSAFSRLDAYCNNPRYRTNPFFNNALLTLKTTLCCTALDDRQAIEYNIAQWKQQITLGLSSQFDGILVAQNTVKDRHRLFSSREGDPLYFIENILPFMLSEIQFHSLSLTA